MNEELKPCANCGGAAKRMEDPFVLPTNKIIFCENCEIRTSPCVTWKEAEDIWNRRAAPENKALTLDELRGMDGEPVWIVEAPDWGHWELSERAEDYLDDRDPDFYGMKHDDPAGRYGLHVLGWLAFARRPEGSAPKAK